MSKVARTVLGDVLTTELGTTLVHEHLHMDTTGLASAHGYSPHLAPGAFTPEIAAECRWNPGAHPDNYRFIDHDAVLEDLLDYVALGGQTIVDATPVDLKRNPAALALLAQESGLNVVMGTGYYLEATHRAHLSIGSEEQSTFDLILDEHNSTGIRPGIIGEIGTSDPPTRSEVNVLRGAARAAVATGLPLSIHLHPWGDTASRVIDVVGETRLPARRILLNHVSTSASHLDRLHGLLERGVRLSFDLFGFDHSLLGAGRYPPSDADVTKVISTLINDGFGGQIMLSQDVGVRTRLRRYGGWGYGHILRHIVPLLLEQGVEKRSITTLLVDNPAEFLAIEEPL